ncbi:ABC transporter ATP-binding protein [Patescibacteria group bacterium]|nr:ABC transporter ATP-binding protein [Patescibacteria group bacterium]MBU1867957.1 ABC transporter ATP-binding protein [Patescibacteria group bacterium]
MKKHIIRLEKVNKEFPSGRGQSNVLHEAELHIYPQEFTIIYGPSGSGKSTLLNTIIGLEPPTTGKVYVQGRDVFGLEEDARAEFRNFHYGVVYQQANWVKSLNVIENVALPLLLRGGSMKYAQERALYSLGQVGLGEFATKHPSQLSGGEQQKVSVARALSTDPIVIVADEPTGNLDTKSGNEVIQLFIDLIKRFGRTVVMVTHELRFLEFADRAIAIKDGRIEGSFARKEIGDLINDLKTHGIK